MKTEKNILLNAIAQAIFDKKGFNILALDIQGVSSLTDFLIIAEGNVDRHLQAIAQAVIEEMKKFGRRPYFAEGMEEGDWIVLDYLDIIIHLFIPAIREKYQLERLWQKGQIVELQIQCDKSREEIYSGESIK
jgi:ribosome-associated protein